VPKDDLAAFESRSSDPSILDLDPYQCADERSQLVTHLNQRHLE
jgi:hypothetical protein